MAGGWAARGQGMGGWMRAPVGALGGEGGTLSPKAPRARAAGLEIGALPWGRWVVWTERTRSLSGGGRPGWAAKAGKVGGRRPSG